MQNDKTPEQIAEATVRQYITAPFARDQMDPRELIAGLGLSNAQAASIFDMVVDAIETDRAKITHDLADALQDREMLVMLLRNTKQERDAALAVIEKARECLEENEDRDEVAIGILSSVPADVLRERDRRVRAEARSEGLHEALTVLPRPDEDARSGMIHARGLIAARLIEQNSEGNET